MGISYFFLHLHARAVRHGSYLVMLLRSGVAALCLTPLGSAFSPASFLPHRVSRSPIRLLVGLHDQTSTADSDEVILQEKKNVAVLKEVEEGKAYIEWLIGEQRGGTDGVIDGANSTVTLEQAMTAATPGDTLGDSTASETGSGAGGAVELLGGGGGGDPDLAENFPSATTYRPALRSDLGDTVLLSGMAAPDATLLSTLNSNFFGQAAVPNFSFGRIRMLVTDAAAVRKQVIGREARYSGLLDKLTIDTLTAANGLLPSAEELGGATSWIAEVAAGDAATMLPAIADLAKGSAVLKNLVVLVTGVDANVVEGWDAVVVASDNGEVFRPTLLAAGALRNSAEQSGGIVHVGELGRDLADVDSGRTLPRARAYQLLALALALDATAGMTLAAYQYPAATAVAAAAPYAEGEFAEYAEENTVEAGAEATAPTVLEDTLRDVKVESRLVRSIREVGLTPLMELDVLAGGGVASFKEFLDNPPQDESDDTWMIKKDRTGRGRRAHSCPLDCQGQRCGRGRESSDQRGRIGGHCPGVGNQGVCHADASRGAGC